MLRCVGRSKDRQIPLYAVAVEALREYQDRIRPSLLRDPEERALFVNMSGERMSRQGFWKLIKSYQEKAGIEKEITPIPCATRLRPICWRMVRICGPSRICWAMRIFHPPRSTPN